MPIVSVRDTVMECLGRNPPISVRRAVLGIYGISMQARSLKDRIQLIINRPFVRLAVVVVRPPTSIDDRSFPNIQLDLDTANEIYVQECGAWVYCSGFTVIRTDRFGPDVRINMEDCLSGLSHDVSEDEDDLFDLGRNLGAPIVGYFIGELNLAAGCGAHPPDRRGFLLEEYSPFNYNEGSLFRGRVFTHELSHVVGDLGHVSAPGNLMREWGLGSDLTEGQCRDIRRDPDMEGCVSR
jgi:hypothetical protein